VVQTFLTQYFSTMNKIIMQNYQGSINKLIGDAIMAYWGFPLDNEDHAFLAVSAAMSMRQAMLDWRKETDKLPINIGIGINTGEAVIGNVGSEEFMDFTVIGDAVNVASRLEGINKEYGTTIIISRATYEKVKDRIQVRSLGWAELKGKDGQIEVFEPLHYL
jgi:adenylate cyclase